MLKQDVIHIIDSLLENVSMEEIMYRLYVLDKHKKALNDIENGHVYRLDEVREELTAKRL